MIWLVLGRKVLSGLYMTLGGIAYDLYNVFSFFKVQETELKQEDGQKKAERKQKVLKKLECPVTKVCTSSEQSEECKTQ